VVQANVTETPVVAQEEETKEEKKEAITADSIEKEIFGDL